MVLKNWSMLLQPLLLFLVLQNAAAQLNIQISAPSWNDNHGHLGYLPNLGLYSLSLDPSKERPAVSNESATGQVNLHFGVGGSGPNLLDFDVEAWDAFRITEAHIHKGDDNTLSTDGPVVLWLYPPADAGQEASGLTNPPNVTTNGVFAKGTADGTELVGPLKGKSISDLSSLAQQKQLYVNVHNIDHPHGLLRSSAF